MDSIEYRCTAHGVVGRRLMNAPETLSLDTGCPALDRSGNPCGLPLYFAPIAKSWRKGRRSLADLGIVHRGVFN